MKSLFQKIQLNQLILTKTSKTRAVILPRKSKIFSRSKLKINGKINKAISMIRKNPKITFRNEKISISSNLHKN